MLPGLNYRSLTVAAPIRAARVSKRYVLLAICSAAILSAQPGQLLGPAQQSAMQDSNLRPALPGELAGIGIDQKLNQQLPLDVVLKDEFGRAVKLREFFKPGKPV